MLQKVPFSRLIVLILVIGLFATAAYAAHDLACYAILEPSGDYLEADSAIAPKLGIANLGDEIETSFSVEFIAVDKEKGDTVFSDTTLVDYIGPYPDSIEVEFDEWVPEGTCQDVDWDDDGPFIYYDLLGIAGLDTDEERANDTLRDSVTCLLSHDVGVVDMAWPEEPDEPPDRYSVGSKITVTATVENFGYHKEYDIPVRLEFFDADSNNVLLWSNVRTIDSLDWRGNEEGAPYTIEITFPSFTIPNEHCIPFETCTELEQDVCPDDDYEVTGPGINCWYVVSESRGFVRDFSLEMRGELIGDKREVCFTVPHTSWVKLDVFDVDGRWVKSLENDIFEAGHYSRSWDGCDASGRKVATGIYLVRMEAGEFKAVHKIVIMN